jgi:hypothetical protein
MRLGICAGILSISLIALSLWNKRDFCEGWAQHYSARARELRAQASTFGQDDAKEYLISAEVNQLVAQKYTLVAQRPWLPYPKAPLVTANEQSRIAQKY